MFCSNCGTENPAATGFCTQCGQSLGSIAVAAAPVAPAPASPSAPSAAGSPNLATLLGVGGSTIEWGAPAALLVASILADLVFLLIVPVLRLQGPLPIWAWVSAFISDLMFTAAAVAGFRWVRNDAGAAALAAVGLAILQAVNRIALMQFVFHAPYSPPVFIVFLWIANFLFLLILALAVRSLRPTWLGLWLGATGGQLAASLVFRVGSLFYGGLGGGASPLRLDLWGVVTDLLFAAVFAFAFWGGLKLFAPSVRLD